jgi:hypothetical protein
VASAAVFFPSLTQPNDFLLLPWFEFGSAPTNATVPVRSVQADLGFNIIATQEND